MKKNKKLLALVCCMALLVGTVGATLAWLVDQSGPITNTFTTSDINIELTETPNQDYTMVPGSKIAKDPKITVKAGSEACYLFVKVKKENGFDNYLTYAPRDGWTKLEEGVYYWTAGVESETTDQEFYFLNTETGYENGYVTVREGVTKPMMEAIDGFDANGSQDANEKQPQLIFKAFAVQKANIDSVEDAWKAIDATEKNF